MDREQIWQNRKIFKSKVSLKQSVYVVVAKHSAEPVLLLVFLCWEHFSFQCRVLAISTLFHALTNLQMLCLAWCEVLCCARGDKQLWRRVEAGKHILLLLQHFPSLSTEAKCSVVTLCPVISFCLATGSALDSFTENVSPCQTSCPRCTLGTKCLWVPAAAWASMCLPIWEGLQGMARLMWPGYPAEVMAEEVLAGQLWVFSMFQKVLFNYSLSWSFCL